MPKSRKNKKRMRIKLAEYLNELREYEQTKPFGERRQIPDAADIATAIKVRHPNSKLHEVTARNFANGNIKLMNLELAQMFMDELWHMGFRPQENDLIEYTPPEV
jgi:hypothetical protein